MIGGIGKFVFVSAWLFNTGQSIDINSMEVSPFYDAIIFGDIAEIFNDIDNNMNFHSDMKQNSESQSDEEVENLLSEYQHYLEKAEQQRAKYYEKTKSKNKVPLLRRERFSKVNFPKSYLNDKNSNYYTSNIQLSPKAYKRPYDLFTPMQIVPGETLSPFSKIIWKENKMRDFTKSIQKSGTDVMLSSCFCEDNKFPCKCNCKQCIVPLEKKVGNYFEPSKTSFKNDPLITNSNSYTNMGYFNENTEDKSESNLNIRIKFDIQMPKIDDVLKQIYKSLITNKTNQPEVIDISDTLTPMNLSLPSLNLPIPLSIFTYGVSKLHKYDYTPIHKSSVHKKKKSHTNFQNKKHRSKFLSFHNVKNNFSHNVLVPEVYSNDSNNNNVTQVTDLKIQITATTPSTSVNVSDANSIDHGYILNMSAYVNISNDDNIVEVDTTTQKNSNTNKEQNNTTESPQFIRIKRDDKLASLDNNTLTNNPILEVKGLNTSKNYHEAMKRVDNKVMLLDSDLLYWPSKTGNNASIYTSELETLQSNKDLNISEYTMNSNTSWHKSLNKINWNDIDIATSTFSSLVGKYVNGVLTFCSEKHCHSIKCAEKICVQRSCLVKERYNKRGHCSLSPNETDSTISMESSLDVSFDIASELVDTLQNQMLGLTYGKATICINIKCITLVANKKIFTKTKCSKKQLNPEGHCESLKNTKTV